MTKEEAIKNIKEHCYFANLIPRAKEALDIAIKALEQEPCDDAISRQAVLNYIRDNYRRWFINDDAFMQCVNGIKDIVPVTPQPKIGLWIEHFDESGKWYECDQCHIDWGGSVNYCPNCGAKMM